jgi:hypothetical protein
MDCTKHPLLPPKVVAIARDGYLTPEHPFADSVNLPSGPVPKYGQDITSGLGRPAPGKQSVGKTPDELKPKMRKLLDVFAAGDKTGMARRLVDAFLQKQSQVTYFEDAALNTAALGHRNIQYFCGAALSAPNSAQASPGKKRIHQALKEAGWDIKKLVAPTDLGVPAFNIGDKAFSTGDFNNGLGLMINGVQYAYVIARSYNYDAKAGRYCIGLRYLFYDVFGLDDDDLKEFGASSDSFTSSNAAVGITAWWQLQHQHGYNPLVTRIILDETFEAPAT